MLRYETLLLAIPEITADESSALESHIEKTIKDNGGSLISLDRWGKYRLAYPIEKNEYGVYFLVRFETNQTGNALLEALRILFAVRYSELVMRHVIAKLKPHQSLEYQRPESLEDAPGRSVDTFLKENKMTGLLHSSRNVEAESSIDAENA